MKKHIPNIVTLGNLFCGIVAILYAIDGLFQMAFLWCVAGIILDFFDGFVARWLRVTSPLGVQLDSLADMITSGLFPGIVMFLLMKNASTDIFSIKDYLPFLGFLITLASAYRLAKFNIDTRQTISFIGLPTPANALFISSLALIANDFSFLTNYWVLAIITLVSSYLLNSEIQLFALKFKSFSLKKNLQKYVFMVLSTVLLIVFQFSAVPLIIMAYILLSIFWKEKNEKI